MQYALLIYTKPGTLESLSPAEREALSPSTTPCATSRACSAVPPCSR